jgi:hypothetical protein
LRRVRPEFKDLLWPKRDAAAEEGSLKFQAARRKVVPEPSEDVLRMARKKFLDNNLRCEVPRFFRGARHTVTRDDVRSVFPLLNKDGSPGVPFLYLAKTKEEVLLKHSEVLIDSVFERLDQLQHPIETDDPWLLWERGLLDIHRVFIKNEPHTRAKYESGRFRIIMSVSIVDEIISKLIHGKRYNMNNNCALHIAATPGIGFSTDKQCEEFYEVVKPWVEQVVMSDVSGYDWSLSKWVDENVDECTILLTDGMDKDSCFPNLIRNYSKCLLSCFVATSSGKVFQIEEPGVQRTGANRTADRNSEDREFLAYCVGSDRAKTYGDDAIEDNAVDLNELEGRYAKLGLRVTDLKRSENGQFEFCSMLFGPNECLRLNWQKAFFNLVHHPGDVERYHQFVEEFRNSPNLGEMLELLELIGWFDAGDGSLREDVA